MRVLFLPADSVSAQVRIGPLLQQLRESGRVAAVGTADRDLAVRDVAASYDVVLVHRSPSARQFAWLRRSGVSFVYDTDDLLLRASSDGIDRRRAKAQKAIRWCLTHARYITASSRRLLATLEQRLGARFGARGVYIPNTGLRSSASRIRAVRPRLLWVSSADWQFDELNAVGVGINAAARTIGTDVVLVGRFPDSVRREIENPHHVPWLDLPAFSRFLAEGGFIAAAPLPVALPAGEQEFLNCKSDIKAAQYSSLGIAGAYSPALPYVESDLPCMIVPTNTAEDWRGAMVDLASRWPDAGLALPQHPAVAARRVDVVAERLGDIFAQICAEGGGAFTFRATPTPTIFRSVERGIRAIRTRLLGKKAAGRR